MTIIFFLSDQDRHQSSQTSGWIVQLLAWLPIDPTILKAPEFRFYLRKLAHVTEYLILYLLVYRLLSQYFSPRRSLWLALIWCSIYAATDEFHQSFVPGRGASLWDVGIDTAGASLGLIMVLVWQNLGQRKWKKAH